MDTAVSDSSEPISMRFAGLWIRIAAGLIDGIIVMMVNSLIEILIKVSTFSFRQTDFETSVIAVITVFYGIAIQVLYDACCVSSSWRATLGMKAVGIGVVDLNYKGVSFGTAFWWSILSGLSMIILGLGYLTILFDKDRQALHDKLMAVHVIHTR